MAEITAAAVMAVREKTGRPMLECKKAIEKCGGDTAAAVEWLRKQPITTPTSAGTSVVIQDREVTASKVNSSTRSPIAMATCPHCAEDIKPQATKCPHCTGEIAKCPKCNVLVGPVWAMRRTSGWSWAESPVGFCPRCNTHLAGPKPSWF